LIFYLFLQRKKQIIENDSKQNKTEKPIAVKWRRNDQNLNIMTFCAWCGREYEPHKSQALHPKKYCSLQCEEEAAEEAAKKEKKEA